jgi:hypothetical protein
MKTITFRKCVMFSSSDGHSVIVTLHRGSVNWGCLHILSTQRWKYNPFPKLCSFYVEN